MDYHGAKEEHILRYLTIAQRDKRPEERQPLGTGIHAFVFCVASPFTYARYAQGLRLKYKRLYLPSNAQVIFNRALRLSRDKEFNVRLKELKIKLDNVKC